MYNLKEDIEERYNLARVYPERTKDLYNKLEEWRDKVDARMPISLEELHNKWERNERGIFRRK